MTHFSTNAFLSFVLVLWTNSAIAEEPDAARLEEVEATYRSALDAPGEERLMLFRDVRDGLDGIIGDYPASDVAVDILLRREVLGLELGKMDKALVAALGDHPPTFVAPRGGSRTGSRSGDAATTGATRTMPPQTSDGALTGVAAPSGGGATQAAAPNPVASAQPTASTVAPPSSVNSPTNGNDGVAVAAIPSVAATDREGGIQFVPATEDTERQLDLSRQDIRELQARLTALGIDPNGIDGVVGRGTRGALTTWQQASGMPATGYLDAPQLNHFRAMSQSVYDSWLSNPQNRARIEVVAITPARISGAWRFTARCGNGSRMPGKTFTGTMSLEHVGSGAYRGSVRNSQGLIGSVSGRVSGRNFSTTVDWGLFFGRVKTDGRISDDARVVNGQDSNGCKVTASKT